MPFVDIGFQRSGADGRGDWGLLDFLPVFEETAGGGREGDDFLG